MKKRIWSGLLVLCMVLALLPVMSAPAQAAVIGDDYPANLKAYKIDAITDDWGFFNRECTSFVAWRLNSTNGVAFHNYYGGPHWGNASNWGNAAQQIGITVDMNPTVGSVAWISGGHVAWVAEVNGDNVTVEEYNWGSDGLYHTYTWPKSHYSGFIHIKDMGDFFRFSVDSIWGGAGFISIGGWALNEGNLAKSIDVVVYVDGDAGHVIRADKSRPGVNADYPYHGFEGIVDGLSAGEHKVDLYAYDSDHAASQFLASYTITVKPGFEPDFNTLPSDYYGTLAQLSPTRHLTVKDNNVELPEWNTYNNPKQLWHYIEQSDGSYQIINEYNGYALSIENGVIASGTNVCVSPNNGSASQKWYIHDYGDGTFVITPKQNADLALDVNGGATDVAGTNVQIWTRHGNVGQKFTPYIIAQDGVIYEKPSRPTASSVTTTEAIVGTSVSIDWTESTLVNRWDARTYTLTVKDSSGAVVLNETGLTDTSYPYSFPSAGAYTAQVTAVNTKYYDYQTVGNEQTITVKTPCEIDGHVWDDGVITQQPTGTAEGVKTFTCTRCGEMRSESIPKLENPFVDVAAGKFYYDPVLWAISQDPVITTGVTKTTFVPDRICTRAHVVTFLWRANGCPNPSNLTSSFKDVDDTSKYYYKAVLWANEQGITTGYSDGTFRPDDECTRGQVVTFLWRAKGSPAPTGVTNPFSDVPTGKYYTNAVLWALKNNITKGRTVTTFGPDDACTRGHVVTFLYRAYA